MNKHKSKRPKLKLTIITFLLLLATFFVSSYALDDKINLTVDKNDLNYGDEVKVTIDFAKEKNELYAYTAKLSYDKDVFDEISKENFNEKDNWSDITYNNTTNKFALVNKEGQSGQGLLEFTLKVKDNAKRGKTSITVNNITVSDGENEEVLQGSRAEVTVKKDDLDNLEDIDTEASPELNSSDDKVEVKVKNQFDWKFIIVIIELVLLIALLTYVNSNKSKIPKERKKTIILVSVVVMIILLILGFYLSKESKYDVNSDNKVDYNDSKKLMEYLLEIENPKSEEQTVESENAEQENELSNNVADIDNDGRISARDLARLIGRNRENGTQAVIKSASVTNSTLGGISNGNNNYYPSSQGGSNQGTNQGGNSQGSQDGGQSTVNPTIAPTREPQNTPQPQQPQTPVVTAEPTYLSNVGEDSGFEHIVERGKDLYLNLKIDVTPYTGVQYIVVDGVKYTAEKVGKDNYRVKIPTPQTAGNHEISVNNIILDNGKEIKTNYKVTVEILKEKPVIKNVLMDIEKTIPEISIEIEDKEDSFQSGEMTIKDRTGKTVFGVSSLKVGTNKFVLESLAKDNEYTLEININYDLDTNIYGKPEDNKGTIKDLRKFKLEAIYGFEGKNWRITEKVTSENPLITFENAFDSYYDVDTITVEGKEYKVTKNGNIYEVKIEKGKIGENVVKVEKVKLKNGTEYTVNQVLNYTYEPTPTPTVSPTEVPTTSPTEIPTEGPNPTTSPSIVPTPVPTPSETPKVTINAEIENANVKPYVEKGEKFEIIYTIKSNTEEIPNSIVINNETYSLIKNEDGTYKVEIIAKNTAGIVEYNVSKLVYQNEEVKCSNTVKNEVLKNIKPVVNKIAIDEQTEKPTLTFAVDDIEDTFVNGKIKITEVEGVQIQEIPFTDLTNLSFELNGIQKLKKYNIEIFATYDFDLNKEDAQHRITDELLKEKQFEILEDYNFTLDDFKIQGFDRSRNVVILEFISTLNETLQNDYYIDTVIINGKQYENPKKEGNKYTIEVPYTAETRQELTLEQVILNNLHKFEISDKKVLIFKTLPTAVVETQVDNNATSIKTKVKLLDEDQVISSLVARLIGQNGETILEKPIDKNKTEVEFTLPNLSTFKAEEYTVEIGADFDVVDGKVHNSKETIGSSSIIVGAEASITKAEVNQYYVEKNSFVEIKYTYVSNTNKKLTGINIDNTFYQGTVNEDGTLSILVPTEAESYGEKTFTPAIAIFEDETVLLKHTQDAKYYVLKDRPTIDDFRFNEFAKDQTLTFKFNNSENSIIKNANIVITNEQGVELLKQELVENEENTVQLNKLENGLYKVNLSGTYDRDNDELNGQNTYNLAEIFEEKQIKVTSKYNPNLLIKEIKVKKETGKASVKFESTNLSDLKVKQIVLSNGERIDADRVVEEENLYIAHIPYQGEEKQKFTIKAVVLEHDIEIDLVEEKSYEIFKEIPTVTDIKATLENTTVHIDFKFNDSDSIAENAMVSIKDKNNNVVGSASIDRNMNSVDIPNITIAGEYTIDFFATYNRVDGYFYITEKINPESAKIQVPIRSSIEVSDISNRYPEKGEEIRITYHITSNASENDYLKQLTVNGKDYTEQEITYFKGSMKDNYAITVNAPEDKYGEEVFKLTNMKFGDMPVDVNNEDAKVYVLKDKPIIDDYNFNINDKTITFNVTNLEKAEIEGQVVIKTENGETTIQSQDIQEGLNTVKLLEGKYDDNKIYKIVLEGTYNLDETPEDNNNKHPLSQIFEGEEFQLNINSKIELKNFSTRYPERGGNVDITFGVITNTSIPITSVFINDKEYEVIPIEGGNYKTTYKAKDYESGIEELKINKVKHAHNEIFLGEEVVEKIEVLKRKPYVPFDYEIDDNYEAKSITFKFNLVDEDKTIEEGSCYVSYAGYQTADGQTKAPVKVGKNEVTFVNVEERKMYLLQVSGNFDLDTDVLNNEYFEGRDDNIFIDTPIIRVGAVLLPPTDLDISNITAKDPLTGEVKKYLNKNDEFKLSFNSKTFIGDIETTTQNYSPVSAVINDRQYELERQGDTYTTKDVIKDVDTTTAGKKEITIESVTLNNREVVEENAKGNVEVLKDILTVEDFKVDTSTGKAIATYKMTDNDNSFVRGMIVMTDKVHNKISTMEINKGINSYELQIEPYHKYTAELKITYDLDENTDDLENQSEGIFGEQEVELVLDYNLKISDFEVTNVMRDENKATLEFNSTNASHYKVKAVKIGGQTFTVTPLDGNKYAFEYPYDSRIKDQRTEIKIESIILDNEEEVIPTENDTALIFKNSPEVTSINGEVDTVTNVKGKFEVKDEDSTLTKLYAKLKDENGNPVNSVLDLNKEVREFNFEGVNAGKYRVEILADYNTADGQEHLMVPLKESDLIEVKTVIDIKTNSKSTEYPRKGEDITLEYEITSNTGSYIKNLMINESEYNATRVGEGVYRVSYTVPNDTAGLHSIKLQRIDFENGIQQILEEPHIDQVDVLKVAPNISNFSSIEDLTSKNVIFNFNINDPDGAFVSGKAIVGTDEVAIDSQTTSVSFRVPEDELQVFRLDIKYDLDSNKEDATNSDTLIFDKQFTLISNYELSVTNVKTYKNGIETQYFAKNEAIQLRFNSKNKTDLRPTSIKVNDLNDDASEGDWYNVTSVNKPDGSIDYYCADIEGKGVAGKEDIEILAITLSSGKTIERSEFAEEPSNVVVDILKTVPEITNLKTSNVESQFTVSFEVTDDDDALLDSYVKIVSSNGEEVLSELVTKGTNTHTLTLDPGVSYTLTIDRNYNLDSEEGDEFNTFTEKVVTQNIEIAKKEEPNFKMINLTIPKRIKHGTTALMTFENEIMTYQDVEKIVIDGEARDVTNNGEGVYSIVLTPKTNGVNTVNIDSVIMEGKTFKVNRPVSYTHEYIEPTAVNVSGIEERPDENAAVVNYTIQDPDNTIKSLTAYMTNSAGTLAATKPIEDIKGASLDMPLIKSFMYSIELKATYDIGDGRTFDTKTLFTQTKETEGRVTLLEEKIDKEFVEKGESVTLQYKINTNIDQEVKKIYIGDLSYNVERVKDEEGKIIDDTYQITVEAPKEAGVFLQDVTQMQVGGKTYTVNDENPLKIKVLKDAPSLTHFIVDEGNDTMSFRINDKDGALTENTTFTISDDNNTVKTEKLKSKSGDFKYSIKDLGLQIQKQYNVVVNASYDLDPEEKQNKSILNKLKTMLIEEDEPSEEPPSEEKFETSKREDIYTRNITLTGDVDYNFFFDEPWGYYNWCVGTVRDDQAFSFRCDNKFNYKAEKIIIDDEEWPVEYREGSKYPFYVHYAAKTFDQATFTVNKVILENGAVCEVNKTIRCLITPNFPTFTLTELQEDINTKKAKFYFKVKDNDKAVENGILKFILKDSQGKLLQTKEVDKNDNYAEFDIPNPPTAKYQLEVKANIYLFGDFAHEEHLHSGEYDSIINTSILRSEFKTRYPKKGETIPVDYIISSSKVVLVDPEDHANLSKAINITSLVINGQEYSAEHIEGEKYRIYYTAKNTHGLEDLKISQINFSNNTTEIFERTDTIDVLKDVPKVTNYKTENDIEKGIVKFKFDIEDNDNVLTTGSIYATVGDQSQELSVGHNEKEFTVEKDKLSQFDIKASFDLDTDELNSETTDMNLYDNDLIFTKPFMLTGSYDISFNNIKTYNTKGIETKYFEKKEDVKVAFEFKAKGDLYPESIIVNGETYTPERDKENENLYYITIKGKETAGLANANIDAVTLNSGNEVKIINQTISYEVLKDVVKVDSFKYSLMDEDANHIKLTINVSDEDKSNKLLNIYVKDEYGKERATNISELSVGENIVTFEKTNAAKYFVEIKSNYDRDEEEGGENAFENTRVYFEVVTVNTRYIEMKDVVDVQLYKYGQDGSVERVYSLTKDNLEVLENCIVKVTMRDVSPFFSEIKKYEERDGKLVLILTYDDAMIYNGSGLKELEVTLDILSDNTYEYKGSFKTLVDQIKANPTGEFKLEKDYDLSDYPENLDNSEALIQNFEGKLDGNGHIISNLHKPLFRNTKNSEIKNIIFKGVAYSNSSQGGTVVHTGSRTTISNVHIDSVSHVNGNTGNDNGAFAYHLRDGSVLENSSAINISFTPSYLGQTNAGAVSTLSGSTIQNCYVQGKITSGWHFNGALVGKSDSSSKIINNIVNVQLTPYFSLYDNSGQGNGGIISHANGALLQNNLSLIDSNTNASTMYNPRNNISKDSSNNYQLEDTKSTKQNDKSINSVKKADINADLFKKMNFNLDIWNIDQSTSFENLPTLKGKTVAYLDGGVKPGNSEVYIPDYNRILNMEEYDGEREIIYHNMFKLMPFYDAKEILTDGNKIDKGDRLNKKLIKYVLPYNKEGRLVSSLNTKNYDSLGKISIVFEDGEEVEYSIDFDDYYGDVVSYIIGDLNIGYNYNRFILHEDSKIIERLVQEASSYNFTRDLDPVTEDEDSRLYKEFFEQETKNHIREFVENVVTNSGYIPTFTNDVFDNLTIQNLVDTGKLKEMLFTYNYFKYWYRLDMDGVDVADAIMFHGDEMFDSRMTISNISTDLIRGKNSATNVTGNFYNNNLVQYTRLSNLGEFLNYLVNTLTEYKNGDEWFIDNWHGGIYIPTSINEEDTYYTLWDHLRRSGNIQNSFLILFTVPDNCMYVLTCPTQVFYGSLRTYLKDPNDTEQLNKFKNENLAKFTRHIKNFYTFAHTFVGADYLNPFVDVQYDIRTTYTGVGDATVYNNPKTTKEDYHKYFAEAINKWPASNGSGAYATGSEVYWNVIKLINGFNVSSHETLHNQDSKVFLQGNGRRGKDGNSEDYTAGNLQQYFNDGWVSPNIMEEDLKTAGIRNSITQNYKLERVDNNEKLKDFYNKYFRLNDMLDYIEAQAFLTLDKETQVALATQVTYPRLEGKSDEEKKKGDSNVAYEPLTLDKINKMTLKDVSDLWDNQIMLRPGNRNYDRRSPGADTDSLYNIHWYQPHADDDRPDGGSFKWLAWEMAGHKGYFDGYMAYYSQNYIGKQKGDTSMKTTDSIALKYITNYDSFREYKLARYDEAKKHYDEINTYVDAKKIYQEYLEALKKDANDKKRQLLNSTAVKRDNFIRIKEETNDFEVDPFSTKK